MDIRINLEENHGESLNVEALMNQLNSLVMDHRQYSQESLNFIKDRSECCEKDLKVEVSDINDNIDDDMLMDEEPTSAQTPNKGEPKKSQCFVLSCNRCNFLDFTPLNI